MREILAKPGYDALPLAKRIFSIRVAIPLITPQTRISPIARFHRPREILRFPPPLRSQQSLPARPIGMAIGFPTDPSRHGSPSIPIAPRTTPPASTTPRSRCPLSRPRQPAAPTASWVTSRTTIAGSSLSTERPSSPTPPITAAR